MNSASHRARFGFALASAAQLCLSLIVGCAVDEAPGGKSSPTSQAGSQDPDTSIESGTATRGAGMPNVPIHRADAGAMEDASPQGMKSDPTSVAVGALDAGASDTGASQPVPPPDAGSAPAGAAPPQPIHRYSFSGTGMSVPDEQGGKEARITGDAKLDGVDVVDFSAAGDGLVELPDDTFADLSDFSVLVWLYVYSDACWQRAFDLSYTEQATTSSGPGGSSGPGPGVMFTPATLTSLYLTPYGCPEELPTLGYANGTNKYHVIGKDALPQDQELLLGLTYELRSQTLRLIIDGVVASEQQVLLDLHALHRAKAWLGRSPSPKDPVLDGSISELRVYASALEPDVLMQLYTRGPNAL